MKPDVEEALTTSQLVEAVADWVLKHRDIPACAYEKSEVILIAEVALLKLWRKHPG